MRCACCLHPCLGKMGGAAAEHEDNGGPAGKSARRPGGDASDGIKTAPLTCVIADDHPAVVDAVSRYLGKHGIEVVDHARDGGEALAKIEGLKPEVALIDLKMLGIDGVVEIRRARRSAPNDDADVDTDAPSAYEALDAGARGLVLKAAPLPDLVRALDLVATGSVYIDAVLAAGLAGRRSDGAPELSKREREILRLLSHGNTNEEIGRELFISPETVRTHVRRAIAKLDARTRTQAVATALRHGLIT